MRNHTCHVNGAVAGHMASFDALGHIIDGGVPAAGITLAQATGLVASGGFRDSIVTTTELTTAGWVWDNQQTATLTQGSLGVIMVPDPSAAIDLNQQVLAVPSASYQLTVRFTYDGDALNYRYMFCGWKEDTGNGHKMQFITHDSRNVYCSYVFNMTDEKTISAATAYGSYGSPSVYLRVKETGGTVYFYRSISGETWVEIYSVAKAAGFLGAAGYNYLCFGVGEDSNSAAYNAHISHFKLENI